ncbi:excinuclease ABC subunit UvrA [Halobaculum halobium]|uniref:excinuclease ABC subunit UvrA n=1 Tax=Halobaculum halobium TaxID=3032281 RepID=UPI00361C5D93
MSVSAATSRGRRGTSRATGTTASSWSSPRTSRVPTAASTSRRSRRARSRSTPPRGLSRVRGIGSTKEVDEDLVVTDPSQPIKHVFEPWSYNRSYYRTRLDNVADHFGVGVETPFEDLSEAERRQFLYGTDEEVEFEQQTKNGVRRKTQRFEGVIPNLERRHVETDSDRTREHIEEFMAVTTCPECEGTRLKPQSRSVYVDGTSITDVNELSIGDALDHFEGMEETMTERERTIATEILKEIRARLGFMEEVGLEYLTLDREASTLSGGESQRIRLATQVGSGLVGVLYVLDEPSIGLHQRDNDRLLDTLEGLRDLGNTLLVVEHDEATMRRADNIIDIGPGPGKRGGEIVAQGDFDDIVETDESVTGDYLAGREVVDVPSDRRERDAALTIEGARQHNLKDVDVDIPVGLFTAITGVSGSGKSTLMHDVLYKGLAREMNDNTEVDPGEHDRIAGMDNIEGVRLIDQSPIGRTPRSNPATYTDVFDYIRELFAETKLANQRGYAKGRFSFNVKGGRCEECGGQGTVKIEMNFLSDVHVPCEECGGARYNDETLDVTYKGKTIADVLDMSVEEAYDFFQSHSGLERRLGLLKDVGLDYMRLGQPSTTLSGGEAQRVKLAEELGKKDAGDTLYLLDEPTTGLHKADERKLIDVLHRLTTKGNTVVVIEHELDLVKNADHIVDLGPEEATAGARSSPRERPKTSRGSRNPTPVGTSATTSRRWTPRGHAATVGCPRSRPTRPTWTARREPTRAKRSRRPRPTTESGVRPISFAAGAFVAAPRTASHDDRVRRHAGPVPRDPPGDGGGDDRGRSRRPRARMRRRPRRRARPRVRRYRRLGAVALARRRRDVRPRRRRLYRAGRGDGGDRVPTRSRRDMDRDRALPGVPLDRRRRHVGAPRRPR